MTCCSRCSIFFLIYIVFSNTTLLYESYIDCYTFPYLHNSLHSSIYMKYELFLLDEYVHFSMNTNFLKKGLYEVQSRGTCHSHTYLQNH